MKKKLLVLIATILMVGITKVDAMSESDLKAKFADTYIINESTFKLEDYYIRQLETYLNTFEVSETDCDYISTQINEAIKIISAGNAKSVSELTASERKKLSALVSNVSNETSVNASVENGTLVVYSPVDGTVFTKITPPAKQTGAYNYVLLITGTITVVGITTLVIKKGKRENV